MGENVGDGSQECEESGKLKLKVEATSCFLEVETFQICNLLMGTVTLGQDPCSQGDQKCAFGDCRRDVRGVGTLGVGSGALRVWKRAGLVTFPRRPPPGGGQGSCYMAGSSHPVWRVNGGRSCSAWKA